MNFLVAEKVRSDWFLLGLRITPIQLVSLAAATRSLNTPVRAPVQTLHASGSVQCIRPIKTLQQPRAIVASAELSLKQLGGNFWMLPDFLFEIRPNKEE